MPLEFKTRYCSQCDEDVQAERETPSIWSFFGPWQVGLWSAAVGNAADWKCTQCGGAIPVDPEERRRRIEMAVWISPPLFLAIGVVIYLGIKMLLGGNE